MSRREPGTRKPGNTSCIADAVSDLVDSRGRLASGELNVTVQRVRRALARPAGLHSHVAVLLFWGRQQYTRVLSPYLERELATNGGVVDEIWLCMTTPKRSDLQAGRRWAAAIPQVHAFNAVANTTGGNYNYCYDHLPSHAAAKAGWQLRRTLLLKVDDDVVFIDHGALARPRVACGSQGVVWPLRLATSTGARLLP